jgi:hypothetical protein
VPGDLGKIPVQRGDIGVGANAVEPFEHDGNVLTALTGRGDWDFLIVDRAVYGARQNLRLLCALTRCPLDGSARATVPPCWPVAPVTRTLRSVLM